MKICITACGDNLHSQVDPRFGRCRYFIIYDDINHTFEAIANPNIDAGSGAGIQSAQLVASKHVSQIMTGEVGPKAEKVLQAAKIQIITGETNNVSVKDFIEKLKTRDPINKCHIVSPTEDSKKFSGLFGRILHKGFGLQHRGGLNKEGNTAYCICPKCGERKTHKKAVPCRTINCSKCGSTMVRE